MAITDGLITLAQARSAIYGDAEPSTGTTSDSTIEFYVEAATAPIELLLGPLILRSSVTHLFDGGVPTLVLPDRFNSVSALTVDGTAYSTYFTDADAGMIHAGSSSAPEEFAPGVLNVSVTVSVGSATIPKNAQMMARELVRHWWQNGRQGNRPAYGEPPDNPAVAFGVPTRRLMELMGDTQRVAGFA